MTVVLRLDGQPLEAGRRACRVVEGADHVLPEGRCPACLREDWRCSGGPTTEVDDHLLVARGACRECGAWVGQIEVSGLTLFGFDEDRRVQSGRVGKVY